MRHSFGARGSNHGFTVNTVNPEPGFASKQVSQLAEAVFGISTAEVHCIHPTPCRAAEGGMFKVVVENHNVTGRRLLGNGGHISSVQAPDFSAVADVSLNAVGVSFSNTMAARYDAQGARVTG